MLDIGLYLNLAIMYTKGDRFAIPFGCTYFGDLVPKIPNFSPNIVNSSKYNRVLQLRTQATSFIFH